MRRENRRKLSFTSYFIDDESRPGFHYCFMFITPVVASAFQIAVNRGVE